MNKHCEKCGVEIKTGDRVGVIFPEGETLTVCGTCYDKVKEDETN